MARDLIGASSQSLVFDGTVPSTTPLTFSCWFQPQDVSATIAMMWLGDKDVVSNYWALLVAGDAAGDPLAAVARNTTYSRVDTTTGVTLNQWHHGCCSFDGANVAVYLDGGSKGTGIREIPTDADRIAIGYFADSTPNGYWEGLIAEVAIWNAALTDAEVASLSKAFSPLFIRPGNLVSYHKLFGNDSPEKDEKGAYPMTVTGATKADHPRIIYPGQPWGAWVPAAAGGNPWHYYAQQGAAVA